MRRAGIALVLVLVGASVLTASLNPFGSNEVPDVVRRAATANRRVSYAGRASWKGRRWTRSVAIRHDSSAGLTAYRHNGHEFVLPGPSSRMSDPSAWCLDLDAVLQNYRSRTTGTSALLGRTTRTLVLEPLHPGRPTVTLHLDELTGLPLKTVTRSYDGTPYRMCAFNTLEFGPQHVERKPSRWYDHRRWYGTSVPPDKLVETVDFDLYLPDYLPAGFRLTDSRVLNWMGHWVRLTYSDGITTFELTEQLLLTPAQLLDEATGRMGKKKAERMVRRIQERRIDRLLRSDGAGKRGPVARRRRSKTHDSYSLRLGRVEIKVSARRDLDPKEILRVLRSLSETEARKSRSVHYLRESLRRG